MKILLFLIITAICCFGGVWAEDQKHKELIEAIKESDKKESDKNGN